MGIMDDSVVHIARDSAHIFFNPMTGSYAVTDERGAGLVDLMKKTHDEDVVIDKIAGDLALDEVVAAARYVAFAEKLRSRGLFEKIAKSEEGLPTPFFGFIEVTRKCPTLCRVCAIDTGRGSEDVLTLAEIRRIIDEFKEIGIKFVALTGGDPLVRSDLIEILDYIRGKGLAPGFSTSLVTLKDDAARAIGAIGAQVQVSLDGSSPAVNDYNRGEGSFEKAMQGINLLNKHNVQFRIAFCIMKHNVGDIPAMIKLGEKVGAKEVAFRKIKPLGRALKLKDEVYPTPQDMARAYALLYSEAFGRDPGAMRVNSKYTEVITEGRGPIYDSLPCGAGRNIIHITYKGDIVPCSLFTEEKFVQGNARTDSLARIWEKSDLLAFFRNTKVDDIPKCRECAYKYLCGGGCRAEAYFLHGNLMAECCDCQDLLAYYTYMFGYTAKSEKRITV
jgi:radical SAM protein with 4Fe4S-binding SPASM domain